MPTNRLDLLVARIGAIYTKQRLSPPSQLRDAPATGSVSKRAK